MVMFVTEEIYKKRKELCGACVHKSFNVCKVCGCFIPFKATLFKAECPKKYWGNPISSWGGFFTK
jgi:hypothetical protein